MATRPTTNKFATNRRVTKDGTRLTANQAKIGRRLTALGMDLRISTVVAKSISTDTEDAKMARVMRNLIKSLNRYNAMIKDLSH
jgi:endonuclease III